MDPKVSIIVPIFNVENYLGRCIDSILNQSYNNLELILVNDASTDGSKDICDRYKEKHENVKVIHRPKSGGSASKARNDGLNMATGNYVAFVDSDDWIHPKMVETLLKVLTENKTKVAECDIYETDHYEIITLSEDLKQHITIENRLDAFKRIINSQRFSVCVRLYEYDLIKDIRFPENVISEDVYFTLELIKRLDNLVRIDLPLYYYYMTPNSVTRKTYSLKYFDSLNSGLNLQKYVQENEHDPELLEATQVHILRKLLYHYKMLNYYPSNDPDYEHRKRIKKLINKNYFNHKKNESYLKYAHFLPIKSFEALINLNRLKHKLLKTKEF